MCSITAAGVVDETQCTQPNEKSNLNISNSKFEYFREPLRSKTSKGSYCIAKWCNNNNASSRMFRLPKDKRCQIWLTRAGREDLKDLDPKRLYNKYLCEEHFTENMFKNSKKLLRWDALPTIFLFRSQGNSISPSKDSCDSPSKSVSGQLYKPVIFQKNFYSDLLNLPTSSQTPRSLTSVNSSVNSKMQVILQTQNNKHKVQHLLTLNPDERNEYFKFNKIGKSDGILKLDQKVNENILQNTLSLPCPDSTVINEQDDTKDSLNKNIIKAVKVIECNNTLLLQNKNESDSEIIKKDQIDFVKENIIQGDTFKDEDSSNTTVFSINNSSNESTSGYSNLNEENNLCFSTDDQPVTPDVKIQDVISPSKNLTPYFTVVGDTIENFKDSDVESICSGQGFRESMYPCLACGEVFLAKSSLTQHCKTYHGEIDDTP
ncbi:uncharacterized protein LOC142325091 isoform X2 [Lycorma delicatula]